MKTICKIGMLAVSALALTGCSKEMDNLAEQTKNLHTHTIFFKVQSDVDTKTAIVEGEKMASYAWNEGDEQYFHIYENGVEALSVTMTIDEDGLATFIAEFEDLEEEWEEEEPVEPEVLTYTYTAVYCSNGWNAINSYQYPTLTSFDPTADLLFAVPQTLDKRPEELQFALRRVVSVNKITLKGLMPGEKIDRVELASSNQYFSAQYIPKEKDDDGDIIPEQYSPLEKQLTLNYGSQENAVVGDDGTFAVYFVSAPVENASINIKVVTDWNEYFRDDFASKLTLSVGQVKRLGINLSGYGFDIRHNVPPSMYIPLYWNDNLTATKANAATSSIGDGDPDHCVFINNLNAPFLTNSDGILNLESISKVKYFFCNTTEQEIVVPKVDGMDVVFSVSDDGLVLKANIGGEDEDIAIIDNDGEGYSKNTITLNKQSELAKSLLNTGQFYVNIAAMGIDADDESLESPLTFNRADYFRIDYLTPISIPNTLPSVGFTDGRPLGLEGSFIRGEDLVAPLDWRGRSFSQYDYFWGYYGPFVFIFDYDLAKWENMDGSIQPLPSSIQLEWMDYDSFREAVGDEDFYPVWSDLGYLTYKNQGDAISTNGHIILPAVIEYGWGRIKIDNLTIDISAAD